MTPDRRQEFREDAAIAAQDEALKSHVEFHAATAPCDAPTRAPGLPDDFCANCMWEIAAHRIKEASQ